MYDGGHRGMSWMLFGYGPRPGMRIARREEMEAGVNGSCWTTYNILNKL